MLQYESPEPPIAPPHGVMREEFHPACPKVVNNISVECFRNSHRRRSAHIPATQYSSPLKFSADATADRLGRLPEHLRYDQTGVKPSTKSETFHRSRIHFLRKGRR